METKQPDWKLIADLGDVNPVDYGGFFVYSDTTGRYAPEAEHLDVGADDGDEDGPWTIHRFILERCTFIDGILSDNKYHPDYEVWFGSLDKLESLAGFADTTVDQLRLDFCSDDAVERAHAYRIVGEYFGFVNLDQYPLTFTDRATVEHRYLEDDGNGQIVHRGTI